jgi:hypothetical protein
VLPVLTLLPSEPPARAAAQQSVTDDQWCRDYRDGGDGESHCEVREFTLPAPRVLELARVANGSIEVTGGTRSDVRVRARVIGRASRVEDARRLVSEVRISTEGGRVQATGPSQGRREGWWISYRVEVPTAQDLQLDAANGSIAISDVRGRLRAHTANGSLRLSNTGGDVDVETSNGSLAIELAGSTWEGSGLRARTANGSLRLEIPEKFNATLRAGTMNGRLSVGFPLTIQGRFTDEIDSQLGSGGPVIDVRTMNGSLTIERR